MEAPGVFTEDMEFQEAYGAFMDEQWTWEVFLDKMKVKVKLNGLVIFTEELKPLGSIQSSFYR